MIRDNHGTWLSHKLWLIVVTYYYFIYTMSKVTLFLTTKDKNWWQIVDKISKDQETLEILREKSQTFLVTASYCSSEVSTAPLETFLLDAHGQKWPLDHFRWRMGRKLWVATFKVKLNKLKMSFDEFQLIIEPIWSGLIDF